MPALIAVLDALEIGLALPSRQAALRVLIAQVWVSGYGTAEVARQVQVIYTYYRISKLAQRLDSVLARITRCNSSRGRNGFAVNMCCMVFLCCVNYVPVHRRVLNSHAWPDLICTLTLTSPTHAQPALLGDTTSAGLEARLESLAAAFQVRLQGG